MLAKGVGSGGEEVACAGAAWNTTSPATQPGGKYVLRKERISTRVEDAFSSFWIMAVRVKGHLAASTKARAPKAASKIARPQITTFFFIHDSCCGCVSVGKVACMVSYVGCRDIVIERHSRPAPGCTQLVPAKSAALLEFAREFSMPIQRANRSLWLGALFLVMAFVLGSLPFFAQIPGQQALPWLNLILGAVAVAFFITGLLLATRQPALYRG